MLRSPLSPAAGLDVLEGFEKELEFNYPCNRER